MTFKSKINDKSAASKRQLRLKYENKNKLIALRKHKPNRQQCCRGNENNERRKVYIHIYVYAALE